MKTMQLLLPIILMLLLQGCGKDNPEPVMPPEEANEEPVNEDPNPDPAETLAMERRETIKILTSDDSKTWRFEQAVLTNENGTFDISENFNTQDDELLFKNLALGSKHGATEFRGNLEWRQFNAIAYNATSIKSAELESLVLPKNYDFDFIDNSGSEIDVTEANMTIQADENDRFKASIMIDVSTTLEVVLVSKTDSDYPHIPSDILTFEEVFSFNSNDVDNRAADMIGSLSNNSFYIVVREEFLEMSVQPERVVRYDFLDQSLTERLNYNSDFVSKELFVYNNELKVVGGQRINTYDLNLLNEPYATENYDQVSGSQNTFFTRFGAALVENTVFIVGGGLGNNYELADKIFTYDLINDSMTEFATMPTKRFGARSEVVNDKLYIFGGTQAYYDPIAESGILIYDLATAALSTAEMTRPVNFTFTGKIDNLIYVAGRIDTYDGDDVLIDRDPFLGVFDTQTGEFQELETNLQSNAMETIHSMTVFDGKIYILFGQVEDPAPLEMQEWSVLAVDI